MESLLFKYLKDKATNDDTKNNLVYADKKNVSCTYETLYQMVLKKMKLYKEKDWNNFYLLALNDIESISSLIALIAIGKSPIILNGVNALLNHMIERSTRQWDKYLDEKYHIINDHPDEDFYMRILIDNMVELENCEVINKQGEGMIGIFSSGTLSTPKIIYINEKTLIDKVFESNYVDENRIIYNTAPLSTISGLFTNVFAPIVSNNTKAIFSNKFSPQIASIVTDLYLPRNYADAFINTTPIDNQNIKRIFTYGEQNSKAIYNFIREKISNLQKNVFVNVYGTTECGGLVSEIEEKDMDELHVYYLDILNDTIIYSYDDQTIYKKVHNTITILDEEEKKKYPIDNITKYLPCGFISNKITINNNNCIGECLVNDFNTGDIITIIDDKFYVIGRKNDLDKNHYLANYDSELSSQSGRICATFTDDDNNLCVAIRCSLEKEDNLLQNHTTYFRRLLTEAPKIRKLIQDRYPNIKKTVFLPNFAFKLSSGIKKSNRKSLGRYLKYGEVINKRIDNYDEILKDMLCVRFKAILGYIPDFKIVENHNIIVNKKNINLQQMVKVLNAINIVAIYEDGDYYKLFYDDSFFFCETSMHDSFIPNKDDLYGDEKLFYYQSCAKYNLLLERLAVDNYLPTLNIDDSHLDIYKDMIETYVFFIECSNDDEVILIPYYYIEAYEGYQFSGSEDTIHEAERMENGKKVLEMLKDYKDYEIDEFELYMPLPINIMRHNNDILYDVIRINDDFDDNTLKSYLHRIIKNTYLLSIDSILYRFYNKFFINSKMTKILK